VEAGTFPSANMLLFQKEREKISAWSRKYMAEAFKGTVWPE
jgi:hypothetical protein